MSLTTTDPISDMFTRIRNALLVRKDVVNLPHSSVKEAIARLLMANKYIVGVKVSEASVGKMLTLQLSSEDSVSPITAIKRTSTPGRRQYTSADEIPVVKRGRGLVILSTNQGIITGVEAKKQHIGGELICEVY